MSGETCQFNVNITSDAAGVPIMKSKHLREQVNFTQAVILMLTEEHLQQLVVKQRGL